MDKFRAINKKIKSFIDISKVGESNPYSSKKLKVRLVLAASLIGLVSGLSAVLLKNLIEWSVVLKASFTNNQYLWIALPSLGLLTGLFAGYLIEKYAATASGSGVPQVKAVLAYLPLPINLRTAFIKLVSTTLCIGGGLSLGRQEPTIYIGTSLAAQLSRWLSIPSVYYRQLLAAGAAAGLSAGFNTPVAGVLFVIEELLQEFSGLTLSITILASFIGALVSRLIGGEGLNLLPTILIAKFSTYDLPFLIILGVLSGCFGALFSQGIFTSLSLFNKFSKIGLSGQIGLAGLVTGLTGALLPIAAADSTGLREFLVTGSVGWQLIAIAFTTTFLMTLLAYGSKASGGIFAPSLVLGSALGTLVSYFPQAVTTTFVAFPISEALGNTTTYALTGMGAFFCAVTQMPITAIVIIFEMTNDFNLVLPLMLCCLISYTTSSLLFRKSLFDLHITWENEKVKRLINSNPYQFGNPLRQNRNYLFKGRKEFAERIAQEILNQNHSTLILHGPRRIGKSSFLLNMLSLLPNEIFPVYLNMQSSAVTSSESAFCYGLARAICKDAKQANLPLVELPSFSEFEDLPFVRLELWLESNLPKLKIERLLFNFDEFEKIGQSIEKRKLSPSIFDELSSLSQTWDQINFLFSGVQTLENLGDSWSNYFIDSLPIEMSYLNSIEAEDLLRNPVPNFNIRFDNDVVQEVLWLTNCHPYLVQLLGSSLFKHASLRGVGRVKASLLKVALDDALETGEPYFTNVWMEFTGNSKKEVICGQKLLLRISRLDLFDASILDSVSKGSLRKLEKYHVIKYSGNKYIFEIPIIQMWIERKIRE
jgi:H+/Cl- antiporter ClcA